MHPNQSSAGTQNAAEFGDNAHQSAAAIAILGVEARKDTKFR